MNTGVDKQVGYGLEVLDEYFAYGNTKPLDYQKNLFLRTYLC